jgi:2-hydroxychromene-2-carboxylate isomerase
VNARVARSVAELLTSPRVRDARRRLGALSRRVRGGGAVVHYFHQVDDPYSQLMLQVLPRLAARYEVRLVPHLVEQPSAAAAPDRERLQAWSRRDAAVLAAACGLAFVDPGAEPEAGLVALASRAIAQVNDDGSSPESVLAAMGEIGRSLWSDDPSTLATFPLASAARTDAVIAAGTALRRKWGHYLGAMLYFEGEWYWGIDRLWHLEQRLRAAGLWRGGDAGWIVEMPQVGCRHRPGRAHAPELHFFCSLRSPYTYLAVARVLRLARHYGASLRLRFVLPMVMRGLPVPRAKRLYILRDAKREAEALGLPFGRIVDPVGAPTERGLAVLHRACEAGRGEQFLESFMRGVWAEGLDAGSDAGLQRIAMRAGLEDAFVRAALADPAWRGVAQANREEMLALGLWGVPSFRVDAGPARWGQDRLWQVERDLIVATAATPAVIAGENGRT